MQKNNSDINSGGIKLIMTLLVRDEEDILKYNIDFHLSKGVDFIIATDNASKDRTREILKEYERKGNLLLIDQPEHNYDQAGWVNKMAAIAAKQYGADAIFHCDADEFWHPISGNLKDEISKRNEDILLVDLINILLLDKGGEESFPDDTKFAVVDPLVALNNDDETMEKRLYYFKYPPKVIFKVKKKLLEVSQGNHSITNMDGNMQEGKSRDIRIYHYPVRSKANFRKKTILGGTAYERNEICSRSEGFHIRSWYSSYKNGQLEDEYNKLILSSDEAARLFDEGFIEELDFKEVILGKRNNSAVWRYYNRKFEYEGIFEDYYWPWAGHKRFAYDLIRNVKPQTIVALGTHKGTSFFSFCQAVKDSRHAANLCAIDTWQGDEQAGYYDEKVFDEVQKIYQQYYMGLHARFIRKTFDDASSEFAANSIDLLHIDGYHTYEAVKHDFDTWVNKVKPDGIILLHDIFINREDFGVYKFWDELKLRHKTIEFNHSYGLGVVFKDSSKYEHIVAMEKELQMTYAYISEEKKNEQMLTYNDRRIGCLTQKVTEQAALISQLTSSRSWKLTRPLRFVARLLRG